MITSVCRDQGENCGRVKSMLIKYFEYEIYR